jgi:hypothetical protein
MGGGGGITGVDYIGEVAKPDEVTAGYFTGSLSTIKLRRGTLCGSQQIRVYHRRHGVVYPS